MSRGEVQGNEPRVEGEHDGDGQDQENDGHKHGDLTSPALFHEGRQGALALIACLIVQDRGQG